MSRNPFPCWALALTLMILSAPCSVLAAEPQPAPAVASDDHTASEAPQENEEKEEEEPIPVPQWLRAYTFERLGRPEDSLLLGIRNTDQLEFGVRRDRLATDIELDLDFTPSPALLPVLSHLRVYLNDGLMGVVPFEREHMGQRNRRTLRLDPRLLQDFNRVRLEFVGHYADNCEDPTHSSLWVNIHRTSAIRVREQALAGDNDLAYFPLPFFDARDNTDVEIPMIFAASPSLGEQKAAAILASYFGTRAEWRPATFPVHFDALPEIVDNQPVPAIVFATNDRYPAFLADEELFPEGQPLPVEGPVVQQITHPLHPYGQLLLVLGRHDEDLIQAASALAVGSDLLRGSRVEVEDVRLLQPREPYDAPNWVRTDRPVRFAELLDYPEQLQVSGLKPSPVILNLNLPPDLFVWRNQGIPLRTLYRYTPPAVTDESRLSLTLNNQYITSFPLLGSDRLDGALTELRLGITPDEPSTFSEKSLVPSLKVGDRNQLRYDFSFASKTGNAQRDTCQSYIPVDVRAAIDENSGIDLSGYHHYIAMPNLAAFSRSAFPFSRMADLSETVVLMPSSPDQQQVGTLLDLVGVMGARIGYPALGIRLSDDWASALEIDADLLFLGPLPDALRSEEQLNLVLDQSRDWLQQPHSPWSGNIPSSIRLREGDRAAPISRVDIVARAPIAAIVGLQSPHYGQRSIVGLLASAAEDYRLLRQTLGDSGLMHDHISGSVSVIRTSGVSSHFVGDTYYVGHLPWWTLLWFHLSHYPLLLALGAVISILLLAFVAWHLLRWVANRRLQDD